MIVVLDASVILKWVLEKDHEPDYQQAATLQHAFLDELIDIRLPTLWKYEVGNILGLKKPSVATELMSALLAYEFDKVPLQGEYALAVLEHMRQVKHVTFYDSAYHVLALRTKGLYVTADTAYVKRAKQTGHVALLSEWEMPTPNH